MSINNFEKMILNAARIVFNNRALKIDDIQEWATTDFKIPEDEVKVRIETIGVYVSILKEKDLRETPNGHQ